MSARAKLKFVRGRWERIEPKAEPVRIEHLVASIHNLAARITSIEVQLASLANPAATPKRAGRTMKSAAQRG
jgi:hypothetical protein